MSYVDKNETKIDVKILLFSLYKMLKSILTSILVLLLSIIIMAKYFYNNNNVYGIYGGGATLGLILRFSIYSNSCSGNSCKTSLARRTPLAGL